MNFNRLLSTSLASVATLIALASTAQASVVVGGRNYVASTPTETVSASFMQANGGSTTNSYGGLVQLSVSGTGQSLAACFNDAFYVYTCGIGNDSSYYQLTTDDTALVGLRPAQNAKNFIVYDVDAGIEVTTMPYVPTYQANHTYNFVVDLALMGVVNTSRLYFGVGDGQFGDNSGGYRIQVTQLSAVPEPGTLVLVAAGLGFAALRRRPA